MEMQTAKVDAWMDALEPNAASEKRKSYKLGIKKPIWISNGYVSLLA